MNGQDLAFPYNEKDTDGRHYFAHDGLTKREYFAALAMQGMVANSHRFSAGIAEAAARDAVEFADALIAALNAEPQA